jgi:HK97 family phage major capsid protein
MSAYLARQIEARQEAWHAAKSLLDRAASESRDLSGEEEQSYQRMMEDIDKRGQVIADLQAAEAREADIAASVITAPEVRGNRIEVARTDADIVRSLAAGEMRSYTFERRDLNTTDDSSIVPQSFYDVIQENLITVGPMVDGNYVTLLNTASGEDIKVPVESTRPAATAIAEATQITKLDPTFSSITLKSQKVAVLTVVSREILTDSGIDLVAFLGRSLGTSLGIKANGLLTTGTGGAVEPNGIVTASGSGVTGGTGVSGVPTADNLIDLVHSVDSAYIRRGARFMARRTTIGAIRKLKDTAGNYLFVPAATVGSPDTLLGFEIVENPDVAATGTAVKSVLFGWTGSYHTRMVGGLEIARSDDAYFDTDEVGFRGSVRIWGDLGQPSAVKHFVGGTA